MTNCEWCARLAAGESVEAVDHTRANRLLLSLLNGALDSTATLYSQTSRCHDCICRITMVLAVATAGLLRRMPGGDDEAIKFLEQDLLHGLDAAQGGGPASFGF